MTLELEIIYEDEYLVAINKPHGLLVHRSHYAANTSIFAVQELRNQIGQLVYPCHRLDRKTGGALLFGLDKETNSAMQQQFAKGETHKTYLAIVRGYTDDEGTIDYALTNGKGKTQDAETHYKTLCRSEIPLPFGKFSTSRYSFIEVSPKTGRMHQIRKHMAHIFHPIIGDRPHGCNKQNRLFKDHFEMTTMMLHASTLSFIHPITSEEITINAKLHEEFERMLGELGLEATNSQD